MDNRRKPAINPENLLGLHPETELEKLGVTYAVNVNPDLHKTLLKVASDRGITVPEALSRAILIGVLHLSDATPEKSE